jgi:hypothetical protein
MIGFCIVCPRLASLRREILTGFFGEVTSEISITRASSDLQCGANIPIGLYIRRRDSRRTKKANRSDARRAEPERSGSRSDRRVYDLPQIGPVVTDMEGIDAVIVEQS